MTSFKMADEISPYRAVLRVLTLAVCQGSFTDRKMGFVPRPGVCVNMDLHPAVTTKEYTHTHVYSDMIFIINSFKHPRRHGRGSYPNNPNHVIYRNNHIMTQTTKQINRLFVTRLFDKHKLSAFCGLPFCLCRNIIPTTSGLPFGTSHFSIG